MSNDKKDKSSTQTKRLLAEEKEYIRQNCMVLSDLVIAEHLKRDVRSVARTRKGFGITKGCKGKIDNLAQNSEAGTVESITLQASQRLNEKQRKEFFKTQLTNTLYYQRLQDQFTEDEINFYLEEWGALCLQFEDIVATEKRQIDELIKVTIIGNRIMSNVKVVEEEIQFLRKEIQDFRDTHPEIGNDSDSQEYDNSRTMLLRQMMGQSQVMTNDYTKNIEMKNKLLGELNARRRDRVDQLVKRGTTFLGLVAAFRDRATREEHGRHIELVRMAKEKKKNEWRKPITFEDGTKDCILMDEYSILPERDIVLLEDMGSLMVQRFSKEKNQKILVIDNDERRKQFFAHAFRNNHIDFANNSTQAIEHLNNDYDLVCLDYDLQLGDKGDKIVKYILDKDLEKTAKFVIQSMNKKASKEMYLALKDKRDVELCPFEEIIKFFIENQTKEQIEGVSNVQDSVKSNEDASDQSNDDEGF